MTEESGPEPFTQLHRDGSLWARGFMLNGRETGYWEWFRKSGTLMRSGTFHEGRQVGEWITYDKSGAPYKSTDMGADSE
jgi:antitoxin component YwqK of YwqJK toxin-antitoxin module